MIAGQPFINHLAPSLEIHVVQDVRRAVPLIADAEPPRYQLPRTIIERGAARDEAADTRMGLIGAIQGALGIGRDLRHFFLPPYRPSTLLPGHLSAVAPAHEARHRAAIVGVAAKQTLRIAFGIERLIERLFRRRAKLAFDRGKRRTRAVDKAARDPFRLLRQQVIIHGTPDQADPLRRFSIDRFNASIGTFVTAVTYERARTFGLDLSFDL